MPWYLGVDLEVLLVHVLERDCAGLAFGADLPVIPISNLTARHNRLMSNTERNKFVCNYAVMNEAILVNYSAEKVRLENTDLFNGRVSQRMQVCSPQWS